MFLLLNDMGAVSDFQSYSAALNILRCALCVCVEFN